MNLYMLCGIGTCKIRNFAHSHIGEALFAHSHICTFAHYIYMSHPLVLLSGALARHPERRLAAPVSLAIEKGRTMAICGPNGAGKSLLVGLLIGSLPALGDTVRYSLGPDGTGRPSERIRLVSFRDAYGGNEPAYYQQRWNRADEQEFPTVGEELARARALATAGGAEGDDYEAWLHALLEQMGILAHKEKPVNLLSSGELRRLQTARTLMTRPEVLIVDNPYVGLDPEARRMFTSVLETLAARLTLVLVVSQTADIPDFVSTIVPVDHLAVGAPLTMDEVREAEAEAVRTVAAQTIELPCEPSATDGANGSVVDLDDVTVRYGTRTILNGLDWHVCQGERWALTGENGAGKSTLLSLVCADNPQSYACRVSLFGCRRGRGESIWDVKRRIGYVSPEMYSAYRKPLPAIDIVASGLRDTVGLYHRPSAEERERCMQWLRAFRAEGLADRPYLQLSTGEQHLVLLVRAFVKQPELLVLDEPFHALDAVRTLIARRIIDQYMAQPGRTLIIVSHYEEQLPSCIDHRLHLKRHFS